MQVTLTRLSRLISILMGLRLMKTKNFSWVVQWTDNMQVTFPEILIQFKFNMHLVKAQLVWWHMERLYQRICLSIQKCEASQLRDYHKDVFTDKSIQCCCGEDFNQGDWVIYIWTSSFLIGNESSGDDCHHLLGWERGALRFIQQHSVICHLQNRCLPLLVGWGVSFIVISEKIKWFCQPSIESLCFYNLET